MRLVACAAVAALCCAGCPESYVDPEPPDYDPAVAVYLTTELEEAPALRVRRLRADVALDCEQLEMLPGRMAAADLDPALFDAGWTAQLGPGKRAAVKHRPGAACDLLRFELEGGKMYVATIYAQRTDTISLSGEGLSGLYSLWPEVAGAERLQCPLDEAPAVRWSEPVPVGRGLRIEGVERNAGCARLQIRGGFSWELCAGEAELSLAAGDTIDVSLSAPKRGMVERGTIVVERHPRPNEAERLRMWLGEGPLTRAGNDASEPAVSLASDDRCAVRTEDCGMVRVPARVDVALHNRSVQLRAGEHVRLLYEPGSLELTVGSAELVPIRAAACDGPHTAPRFVAIDRRRAREVRVAADK